METTGGLPPYSISRRAGAHDTRGAEGTVLLGLIATALHRSAVLVGISIWGAGPRAHRERRRGTRGAAGAARKSTTRAQAGFAAHQADWLRAAVCVTSAPRPPDIRAAEQAAWSTVPNVPYFLEFRVMVGLGLLHPAVTPTVLSVRCHRFEQKPAGLRICVPQSALPWIGRELAGSLPSMAASRLIDGLLPSSSAVSVTPASNVWLSLSVRGFLLCAGGRGRDLLVRMIRRGPD